MVVDLPLGQKTLFLKTDTCTLTQQTFKTWIKLHIYSNVPLFMAIEKLQIVVNVYQLKATNSVIFFLNNVLIYE